MDALHHVIELMERDPEYRSYQPRDKAVEQRFELLATVESTHRAEMLEQPAV